MKRFFFRNSHIIESSEGSWVSYSDAIAEIIRLQAIVEKIPKLADGEPAIVGEEAFIRHDDGTIEKGTISDLSSNLSHVYKTREAAEQVSITDRKAREELTAVIHEVIPTLRGSRASYYALEELSSALWKYGLVQEERK